MPEDFKACLGEEFSFVSKMLAGKPEDRIRSSELKERVVINNDKLYYKEDE